MIKMKALRSFGVLGANEGKVSRGREFTAANEHRVRDLEEAGLAYRIETKMQPAPLNREPPPSNKAAEAGPLPSVGGMTGADAPVPSSHQDRPPRRRRSVRSKDEELL